VLASELALVLLLAFAPGLLGLLLLATSGHGEAAAIDKLGPAIGASLFDTFLSWTPVLVLGYMLVRSGEGYAAIGLGRFDRLDAGSAIALSIGSWVLVFVLSIVFSHLGSNNVDFLPKALPLWFRVADALTIAVTAVIILCIGLVYALYFHRTRRLWPLVVAHGAFDLTQLLLILLTRS
jgi:hypothetical protein